MFDAIIAKLNSGMTWAEIEEEHQRELAEQWLQTDEAEELIRSLEHTAFLASKLSEDTSWWKWVIIAGHNTIQGACVCAIHGKNPSGVKVLEGSIDDPKSNMAKIWKWLNSTSQATPRPPWPGTKLAAMMTLFDRISSDDFLPTPYTYRRDAETTEDMKKLNYFRNQFIHFKPQSWAIEVSGMPRILRRVCDVVEYTAVNHRSFLLEEIQKDCIIEDLANLRSRLDGS